MVQDKGMPYNEERSLSALKDVLNTVYRLRAPGGCPWDREQTHQSLRPFLVEEAYETLEILDRIKTPADLGNPKIRQNFIEEWGDVLLQILLHAEIASESDAAITIEAIAKYLNEKLIRRHPHVFGEVKVDGAKDVVQNWEQIKKAEKGSAAPVSVMDSVHKGLPPLARTMKLIQKVTKVGFQWPDLKGPTEKLQEEVDELKRALGDGKNIDAEEAESELGDILFSVCNVAHFLKLDPEAALRSTLRKFETRFRHVEQGLAAQGKKPETSTLEEMDDLWNEAKKRGPKS
ncbi:MAG: nucleoside triphosphate pyrophosphohydrolase [Bdellovibrionales bacterium]|nr:nucleoside triphosphate pyrophosphohydrolase [Bdellovibrionales bacterium]